MPENSKLLELDAIKSTFEKLAQEGYERVETPVNENLAIAFKFENSQKEVALLIYEDDSMRKAADESFLQEIQFFDENNEQKGTVPLSTYLSNE